MPHDFFQEYESDEQEYVVGERGDDTDGEEQVEIAEGSITLDDEQIKTEEDDVTLFHETVAGEDINDDAASDGECDTDSIIDSDDSEYITEESGSDQSGDEDSSSEAEEARVNQARVPPSHYEPSFGGKTYSLLAMQDPISRATQRHLYTRADNFMFNQMYASRGIKLLKERAVAALLKEYKQLHNMSVFGRVAYESLTAGEKKKALCAMNLVKEKRVYVSSDEASSHTRSLESSRHHTHCV